MSGVRIRAVDAVFETARAMGLPRASLTRGVAPDPGTAASRHELPWTDFVVILENLEELLGSEAGLRRFGEATVSTTTFSHYRRLGRVLAQPRDLYWLGARWFGPSLFPMIDAELWELEEGRLVQRLALHDDYRECPQLFHILAGCLAEGPRALGHGASLVELQIESRSATYLISTSARGGGWLGRIVRTIQTPFTVPGLFRELISQRSEIQQGYSQLFEARNRIERQARQLERVNSIGRRLAKEIDLDRVGDLLIDLMLDELGVHGVELWLIRTSPPSGSGDVDRSSFFRRGGRQEGQPSWTRLLETASRPVGTLKVWGSPLEESSSSSDLLQRLLPWIAMALDNARTYEALERHASDLETRVKERTARLLAANHHLVHEMEERRRATDALLASEEQLRNAERLASIGTLAAGIAHEINNPIGSILAAAQLARLVQDDASLPPEVDRTLGDIIAEAKRCGEIVRSILQFSRDEPTEKWDCRLHDIVHRSVRLAKGTTDESGVVIDYVRPQAESWVHANPIQLEQALVNLLRNAIESGADRIEVDLRVDAEAHRARILVRDDGPGIAATAQGRILEPFFTTRRLEGGTGLGLSVVHGISTEHGGRLQISSEPGGGTLAILELPLQVAPTAAAVHDGPSDS